MNEYFRIKYDAQIIVANIPKDFDDVDSLIALADRNYIRNTETKVYVGEGLDQIKRYHKVERAVARGLENNNFVVYYQPIWDATSNKIHSCEALLRLFDDEIGFVSPEEFIRVAEDNGSIVEIGEFVFDEVCRFIVESDLREKEIEFVEVNLSAIQCLQSDLVERLVSILDKYRVPASAINLEITETAAVENEDVLKDTLEKLHKVGFSVSMDDFGTGYSNLMNIFNLSFEIIKIDKSILWNADDNVAGDIILENIANTIKQMDRRIVCEGVETEEQCEKLKRIGVYYCQGYLFSRPIKRNELVEYVEKFNFT
jgi:EAL domain-containing protein (putative c-di-GMP-specific phosphodiesterase class I)